ncbi:MAG: serine acetyltransferase [bacterium]|nr:serine acetyltransferase [bacterium]
MNKQSRIFVYGAGGHGKVVLDILLAGGANVAAVLDDNAAREGESIWGVPVLHAHAAAESLPAQGVTSGVIAIGDNHARVRVAAQLRLQGFNLIAAIHPRANVAPSAVVGEGTVVMAGAVINPDAVIGPNCIINSNATVEHDNRLGEGVHLSPGVQLGGCVTIDAMTHIGLGASVLPGLHIGANVVIGAGAVVLTDIPDNVTAVGVPAKFIK